MNIRDKTVMRFWNPPALLLSTLLLGSLGCGSSGYELAPVSGVVTLYGQPLVDATVSFEPKAGSGTTLVGPGSAGTTDENGRFELATFKQEGGAVVGTHTVRISTYKSRFEDLRTSDKVEVVSIEHVPWHYNRNTELTFEVPSGGTEEADFVLVAEPKQRLGRR